MRIRLLRSRVRASLIAAIAATGVGAVVPMCAAAKSVAGERHYARIVPACQAPSPGSASCFALVRRPVSSGEAGKPGVRAYTVPSGTSAIAGPAGGYTPSDLAGAYGYDPTTGGEGQTVAIVDAFDDPKIESDLEAFDAEYGLPECTKANGCFQKVGQTGEPGALPSADKSGWSVEISLDVEAAHAACQKCKILLVEANNSLLSNLAAAVKKAVELGATVVSNSYGGPESPSAPLKPAERSDYDQAGVPIVAATGDWGWDSWALANLEEGPGPPSPPAPNLPSSRPTGGGAGGTTLEITGTEERLSETVWNGSGRFDGLFEFGEGATGGGCSLTFSAPAWQQDAKGFAATGCGTKRSAADVAAVADPITGFDIFDTFNCGPECEAFKGTNKWSTIGGTSLATPLISGMWALAGGGEGVKYPAASLYGHIGDAASVFDVTQGGNGFCDNEGKSCGINEELAAEGLGKFQLDCEGTTACNAVPGFDGPTGVGAPSSLGIFKPLSAEEEKAKAEEEAKRKAEEEAARKTSGGGAGAVGPSAGGGPSGGVAGFKAAAPKATLAKASLKASANGSFKIQVSCPAGASNCEGTITVQTAGAVAARARVLTVASGSFRVAGGRTATVTLHLSAKARRLIARRHELRLRVSIAAHDSSGQTGSSTATATLRLAKKHR